MRKIILMLTLISFFGIQSVFAQTMVTGTVTSADDGATLPGVSVIIQGTSLGTTTDMDGYFSVSVPEGSTALEFSFVGMEAQTIAFTGQTVINVALENSSQLLDEIVIIGYGTATKQSLVGSVKTITAENLESKSVSNISQSLAGEAAGVRVINTSGQPGSSATIRIRGFGSVNGNRSPLYVLDGIPYSGAINAINPNDIETTTILKDAAATAIYGSRGANGVILLTTKTGKAGTSVIEVDVKRGVNVSSLPRYNTIRSPEQYIELSWEALYNKGVASGEADPVDYANTTLFTGPINPQYNMWNVTDGADLIDPVTGTVRNGVTRKYSPENWGDYGFQNSSRTEANIVMRGGTEKTKYFTSIGYLEDIGYIINSDFKRYNASVSLTHEVKSWLTTNARMSYSGTETNNNGQSDDSGSIFWFVDNMPSIYPLFLRDENGAIVADPVYGGNQYDYGVGRGFGALTNSIADAHFDKSNTKANSLTGNMGWTVKFTDDLTFETTVGMQYYASKYNSLNNPFYGSGASQGGSIWKRDNQTMVFNVLNLLRYNKSFGDHNFEILAAHETNTWERKMQTASKHLAVHPDIDDLNNFVVVSSPPTSYTDQVRLESYFSQLNYNFENTYYFTASVRRDGSSRFVGDNKWDTFGSVGLSWMISKASFMQDISIIDYMKLKTSYGLIGEQSGVGFYPGHNTSDVGNLDDKISLSDRDIGNPDLTWETSKMFQVGIEFSLGKFFDASIDYYVKNTENLIFDRRVGPSVGYAIITVNDGVLRNSGLEFDFTTHFIKRADYGLSFTINGEFLQNKLTTMPIDPATGEQKILDIAGRYGRSAGHSLYDFYTREWAGVDPADGTAMWYQNYFDENGNGVLDAGEGISSLSEYTNENPDNAISITTTKTYADATQKYVGKSAIPTVRGAFRLEGRFKNFDLTAQFIYSLGGYAYDGAYANLMDNDAVGNNNWSTDILDRWQNPGDITNVPRLSSFCC